ncbi:hypothetical protein [Paraflavitalea speifideaquila]|uniref:hypothetical protein n=1 Tax=Paraflavitalea speifideaquila TaxID=3076558 RepID=UPI0028E7D440|nr:hypothetical protein [Paraflavitalea speifideiaquila]
MKNLLLILLLGVSASSYGKTSLIRIYNAAEYLLESNKLTDAWRLLKYVEPYCDKTDTLYPYILWSTLSTTTRLELYYRLRQQFDSSYYFGQRSLQLIRKGIPYFKETFVNRKYWMYKNLVVSSFGLNKPIQARKYQDLLYKAYKARKLPEGMDQYYNFTYFKWKDKNVWGYEWYPEPGEPNTQGRYSKIIYYVYSTNADGTDKEQLYRLHVVRSKNKKQALKRGYVLSKQLENAQNEVSGILYGYTYQKKINYPKLQADIKEVLKENYYPDSQAAAMNKRLPVPGSQLRYQYR